jgi:hypothetical protein
MPEKLVRLIKMCLNETYSKVQIGKRLFDTFCIQNGLKQGDALLPLHFSFPLEYVIRSYMVLSITSNHQIVLCSHNCIVNYSKLQHVSTE